MKSQARVIKVVRKEGDSEQRECCRYLLLGSRCSAPYFHFALQHVFSSPATANCLLLLVNALGKLVKYEDLEDNGTYFVVFEVGSGEKFEESATLEDELMDSLLSDPSRVKVMLPDTYLRLKIEQIKRQAEEIVRQLTYRLDYSRVQMVTMSEKLGKEVGFASAHFLEYASQVNALTYRHSLISPALAQVLTEATALLSGLKALRETQTQPLFIKPTLARVSPERLPAMSITKKMLEETGMSNQELRRFLRFASRNPSEVPSESSSHAASPKAQQGDLDRSRGSSNLPNDAKSVSGSDTSGTRERKVLTRLRDKAKASEAVLQTTISAFLHEGETITRIQLMVLNGFLKMTGLGRRGNRAKTFAMGELEAVKRLDEGEKTLVVRFAQERELKIGFTDEATYYSWVGAFEDQLALIRGSFSSPKRTQDGSS